MQSSLPRGPPALSSCRQTEREKHRKIFFCTKWYVYMMTATCHIRVYSPTGRAYSHVHEFMIMYVAHYTDMQYIVFHIIKYAILFITLMTSWTCPWAVQRGAVRERGGEGGEGGRVWRWEGGQGFRQLSALRYTSSSPGSWLRWTANASMHLTVR